MHSKLLDVINNKDVRTRQTSPFGQRVFKGQQTPPTFCGRYFSGDDEGLAY
jgi:hypothetical protein